MYGSPLPTIRDSPMRQSIDSLSPFARFRRTRGRIFTAKPDLDERPRSWCFTTCCEMRLVCRSRTLCGVRNYSDMTCFVLLGVTIGRRLTLRIGPHLFVSSTIMLVVIQNGRPQIWSEWLR